MIFRLLCDVTSLHHFTSSFFIMSSDSNTPMDRIAEMLITKEPSMKSKIERFPTAFAYLKKINEPETIIKDVMHFVKSSLTDEGNELKSLYIGLYFVPDMYEICWVNKTRMKKATGCSKSAIDGYMEANGYYQSSLEVGEYFLEKLLNRYPINKKEGKWVQYRIKDIPMEYMPLDAESEALVYHHQLPPIILDQTPGYVIHPVSAGREANLRMAEEGPSCGYEKLDWQINNRSEYEKAARQKWWMAMREKVNPTEVEKLDITWDYIHGCRDPESRAIRQIWMGCYEDPDVPNRYWVNVRRLQHILNIHNGEVTSYFDKMGLKKSSKKVTESRLAGILQDLLIETSGWVCREA